VIAVLRETSNSSTKKQHQVLVMAASTKGLDLHEVRKMVGGSLCALSAKQCSDWIKHFSGRDLPNPPGGKPSPYKRRRRSPSPRGRGQGEGRATAVSAVPRMIQQDHIDQIGRLMLRYFEGNIAAASAWFLKNWQVAEPRDLLDAARAGEVIRALKIMVARRENPAAPSNQNERLVLSREGKATP